MRRAVASSSSHRKSATVVPVAMLNGTSSAVHRSTVSTADGSDDEGFGR